MTAVLELTCDLIRRASLTPEDAGCQALIAQRLQRAGFEISHLPFGKVENLWATQGEGAPVLCFLGHTDVVPTGPVEHWSSPPFEPSVREGRLYGRGAADMKGSVAAMVVALEEFVAAHPRHGGTVALLLTSDEEGDAIHGVRAVAQHFADTGQRIDACIVGEPSARERLGDTMRIGRRGSLAGTLTVHGVQGHVAYPHLADNPIHRALPALTQLAARRWDEGSEGFPPTSFQIAHITAGTGASNVIPGELRVLFNFRYCPRWTADGLIAEVEQVLKDAGLNVTLHWHRSGDPFFTPDGPLRAAVREVVREITGLTPEENTAGGTSDGRFIAPLGAQVVEVGPLNASIHQIDEFVPLDELERLPALYRAIAERVLVGQTK
ncbi:MAG TPA: succinyl-diaminopimelate desuccinylase [Chiayiivirga sp.]|nr:succinyl-diaminopimelate desuccinylase [Chiayiivirga sp.]